MDEQPFFRLWEESELAAKIQCPLHGARFEPRCHLYVAKWRWENEVSCRWPRLSGAVSQGMESESAARVANLRSHQRS
jgi:hypothetical protein